MTLDEFYHELRKLQRQGVPDDLHIEVNGETEIMLYIGPAGEICIDTESYEQEQFRHVTDRESNEMKKPRNFLVEFKGPVGCGKSKAMEIAQAALRARGYTVQQEGEHTLKVQPPSTR